jgi:hypothetical protein
MRFAIVGFCMQAVPNLTVCRTPDQGFTGWGACQRSSPTGGAAKGIPLNSEIPSTTVPAIVPPVTSACMICALAAVAATSASAAIKTAQVPFIDLPHWRVCA